MSAAAYPPTAYKASLGSYTAASDVRKSDRQLLSLVVETCMDGGARCLATLSGAEFSPVGQGDTVTVALDGGNGFVTVFTGDAYACETGVSTQVVRAADGFAKLGRKEVEAAYEDMAAGDILKDLIQQAGATAGEIVKGPKFPSYAVHRGPSVLAHARRLVELCGADLFTDGDGKLHAAIPRSGGADHSFVFGETVLALDLQSAPAVFDGFEVWGEGAASAKGADKAHVLCTDLSGVKGSEGKSLRRISVGAVRTGAAAQDVAASMAKAVSARVVRGSMDVFGSPEVKPGDLVAIDKLPRSHAAASLLGGGKALRVRGVRHSLSRERGLRTRLEF